MTGRLSSFELLSVLMPLKISNFHQGKRTDLRGYEISRPWLDQVWALGPPRATDGAITAQQLILWSY